MNDLHDLEVILQSRVPIVIAETHEERRLVELFVKLALRVARPLFRWAVTDGLQRIDIDMPVQRHAAEPGAVLGQIKATGQAGIYLLLDFHPYLSDPVHVRTLREIAQQHDELGHTVVLISPSLAIPAELEKQCARLELAMPDSKAIRQVVLDEARRWSADHPGRKVRTDNKTLDAFVRNLAGLTIGDARRLARNAIYEDGAITESDLPGMMEAKYRLFDKGSLLSFEYDTARFSDVGGLARLRRWLEQRQAIFQGDQAPVGLDRPKGILLLGVQGCGKSLAARAVAGMWQLPLLRLDFAALYNKYIGETEKNLREAMKTAEVMAPCVLWIDEIEKGLAGEEGDSGTSRRILGTLLTWMADNDKGVFLVATANDISRLPPELIRKGRMDELFFVDLPDEATRATIFAVHLKKREQSPDSFDCIALARAADGFSGSEIEQVIVSGLYSAHAAGTPLTTGHLLEEIGLTRPLSVVMSEKIEALRQWAQGRTVAANS